MPWASRTSRSDARSSRGGGGSRRRIGVRPRADVSSPASSRWSSPTRPDGYVRVAFPVGTRALSPPSVDASVEGTRLHYEVAGETGPLVVLTHGLGGRLEFFTPHVEPLASRYRVVRWD